MRIQTTVDRRDRIIQLIRDCGKVYVGRLSEQFGVSNVTIRNDLEFLEKKGILYRVHGGAMIDNRTWLLPTLQQNQHLCRKEKLTIGRRAAEMIGDGDCILLGSGSNRFEIAAHLNSRKNLTVMTNSIHIGVELAKYDEIHLLFTGGELQEASHSFVGRDAEAAIRNYCFDTLFLGVDGLDVDVGMTTPHLLEARLSQVMVERSRQVVGVIDSDRLGRRSFSRIGGIEVLSKLITGQKISRELEQELHARNVNVIKV